MTGYRWIPNEEIHALTLRVMGAFSHVQALIDNASRMFLRNRVPAASKVLEDLAIKRIQDRERADLFLAIAAELATDAELDNFRAVFMRVKSVRDRAAHGSRFQADGTDRIEVQKTVLINRGDPPPAPTTIERQELAAALRDCGWLESQVLYVQFASGILRPIEREALRFGVMKPPVQAEEWQGTTWRQLKSEN